MKPMLEHGVKGKEDAGRTVGRCQASPPSTQTRGGLLCGEDSGGRTNNIGDENGAEELFIPAHRCTRRRRQKTEMHPKADRRSCTLVCSVVVLDLLPYPENVDQPPGPGAEIVAGGLPAYGGTAEQVSMLGCPLDQLAKF